MDSCQHPGNSNILCCAADSNEPSLLRFVMDGDANEVMVDVVDGCRGFGFDFCDSPRRSGLLCGFVFAYTVDDVLKRQV